MAKRIVAHNPKKCKVKNNPKLEATAELLKSSAEPHYRRAGEALSLTNDEAIDFLRSVGFSQIVPGTHFAPLDDFATFFDVDRGSFYNFIYRYKLGIQHNPLESISCNMSNFFRVAGLLDKGEIVRESSESGMFDFHFTKTDSHYVTRDRWSVRLISARVAVAMLPIMAQLNGKYRKDKVRSLNGELTKVLREKNERARAIAEAEAAAKAAAEAEAQKAAELKAAIAEDTLYELIKKAVSEVMSGAKISLASPN